MVVFKGIQHNNLHYLKDNIVTGQMATYINSDDDCT